jgi:hypothetical protein
MEIDEKLKILKSLSTKDLVVKIHQYEDELEKALTDQASFKSQNYQFLGSGDCPEIKRILAELTAHAPTTNEAGKKMTLADKEVWLQKQRTENKELAEAIQKQRMAAFLIDDHEIKVEMARRRLTGVTAVMALRTQQIAFLASV